MIDPIDVEARLSALEMVLTTHILQSGLSTPSFDPKSFAQGRRDAWRALGSAVCESCSTEGDEARFNEAYARALERLGELLVAFAAPVQEAIDEVDAAAHPS